MAKVYKTYTVTKANFINIMTNITCPFVTVSLVSDDLYVLVDSTVTINIRLQSSNLGSITITYDGSTTATIGSGYYSNQYIILGYDASVFYIQMNDMGAGTKGRAFFFVYEKIGNECYFGYTGSTSMNVVFYNITTLTMQRVSDGNQYKHTNIFTYDAGIGRIDYSPHDALCQGSVLEIDDPNFVACTTVTSNQVCTFNGRNYYAVGTNTLLEMDD